MVVSFRIPKRQTSVIVAAAMLLLATIVPALASAAQVTERSIALSNSAKTASGVQYQINFTPVDAGGAGAFVVEFCSNSPLVGEACTKPTGLNLGTPTSDTSGFTDVSVIDDADDNTLVIAGTMTTSAVSVDVEGITNPSAAGPMYARIVTYDTKAHAQAYTSTTLGTGAQDQGGVAVYITDEIGVSAAVLESMIFCVAGEVIDDSGCSGAPYAAPTLELGETSGTVKALSSSAVSTGDIYTQISTNAVSGAIVSLKNSVTCGGMKRIGASVCDIAPALQTNITQGQAKFGLVANAFTDNDTALSANGAYQIKSGSGYHASNYALNYLANNSSGVTSPYGDPLLDTNNAPVNNKVMKLTFGASVSNQTPAGTYAANLSLIATGKF